jgi:type VI secretion system Hcp family effector
MACAGLPAQHPCAHSGHKEIRMTSRLIQAWRAALLALGLATTGLAEAENQYFLQISGIPGNSVDRSHKDWIDIESFSWGLTTVTSTSGGGSGVGKASFSDLSWSQYVDISTPKWMLSVATGKHIPTVTLDVTTLGGKGESVSFFQMIFTDTVGTALQVSGGGASLMATGAMSSGNTVKLRYRPQDPKGGMGPWVEGSFNIKTNEAKALFSGDEQVLMGLFSAGGNISLDAGAITPVPEPSRALLLAGGLLGLLALRRRSLRA